MKELLIFPIVFILLFCLPASADHTKGLDAANKGDYTTALKEWKPLAEQGDPRAQFNLGWMYDEGEGVTQDYKTALKWFKLAADQGLARAQYNLGAMYSEGNGVTQDYSRAYMWWHIAAFTGNEDAIRGRDILEKQMTPVQVESALELAIECFEKSYKDC